MAKYVNNNGVNEMWLNIKNWVTSQLLGYSQTGHTHSASDITSGLSNVATSGSYSDLSNKPTIPSKTSDLTNDSGYITSSGSCNYANSAGSSSIAARDSGGTWISGRDNAVVKQTRHSTEDGNSWNPAVSVKTKNGNWTIGTVGYDRLQFSYDTDEDYTTGNNRNTVVELNPESGTIITSANIGSQSVNYANSAGFAGSASSATTAGAVSTSVAAGSTKNLVYASMSNNDQCRIMCGGADNAGYMEIATSDDGNEPIYVRQYNNGTFGSIVRTLTLLDESGNTQFPGTVTAPTFSGNLNGNCNYANSAGNADTVDGSHAWQMQTLAASGVVHGSNDWLMQCQHNVDGDGYFKLYCGDKSVGTKVDRASGAGWADTSGRVRTQSNSDWYMNCNWDGSYFQTNCISDGGGQLPINVQKANYADSAGSVAWGNVSGRPWALSQFTNDSGFITSQQDLSGYVPRSGGVVMTGDTLARTVNNNYFTVCGCTDTDNGASIRMYGIDYSNTQFRGAVVIRTRDYSGAKELVLKPNGQITWDGKTVQTLSDQRLKQQITEIDDKLLDAWEDVNLVQFKYNESVDTKGKSARFHTGYVVQQIDEACKSHNVDISEYGLYCHEEYPEETEEVEIEQKDGTKTKERKVIREASEHYSLRYTECLIVECAYLRKCIKELRNEIEELKSSK